MHILLKHFPEIDIHISRLSRRDAEVNDLLDAAAAGWTAKRISMGTCAHMPHDPPLDSEHLRMEICY